MYCTYSIPGTLYLLHFILPEYRDLIKPMTELIPRGNPKFDFSVESKSGFYQRLYTQWLFSGGAPATLAKLHKNADGSTTVSFSERVRAAIYIVRFSTTSGRGLSWACQQALQCFNEHINNPHVSDDNWQSTVLDTERAERHPSLDSNTLLELPARSAFVIPTTQHPSTTARPDVIVRNTPFRGTASTANRDISDGWASWTPVVHPDDKRLAGVRLQRVQARKARDILDPVAAAPRHEYNKYFSSRVLDSPPRASLPQIIQKVARTNASQSSQGRGRIIAPTRRPPSLVSQPAATTNDSQLKQADATLMPPPERPAVPKLRIKLPPSKRSASSPIASTHPEKRPRGRPRKSQSTNAPSLPPTPNRPDLPPLLSPLRQSTPEEASLFVSSMEAASPAPITAPASVSPTRHTCCQLTGPIVLEPDQAERRYQAASIQAQKEAQADLQFGMIRSRDEVKLRAAKRMGQEVEDGTIGHAWSACADVLYNIMDWE